MSTNEHDTRIEIGFEGSQIMSALVTSQAADELETALGSSISSASRARGVSASAP